MAKKPIRVYRSPPGGEPSPAPAQEEQKLRPPTTTRARVQVYKDGNNKDRLSITQQVVEYGDKGQPKPTGRSRYDDLLHSIYDAVFVTDANGDIKEVNPRAEHYFLWNKEELREANIVQLISGADERLLTVIRDNVSNRKYTVLEAVCVTGDDSRFHAEIVVNRLDDEHLCFFMRDITSRKKV